jgi:MFS transporter, DHA1 family, tetracycline resistance protein
LAYFLLPESLKEKQSHIKFQLKPITQLIAGMKINIVRELFILNFVFTLAFSMMYVTVSVFWKNHYHFDELQIGYVFSYIGITSAVVQGLLVGPMNKRYGERKLLYAGLIFGAIGLVMLPFVPANYFWIELVALAFIALANGCITPSILGLLSNTIGPREQGAMLGLNQSTGALARVFGPAFGGILLDLDYRVPYITAGAICLVSLYIVHDLIKNKIDRAKV